MTRSVIREHIFKLLFRVEFHDAHELDGQIRLYMNELGTISEADCKYITEKTPHSRARAILRDFRPDLVVGTGGYASYPVVKCAAGMGTKSRSTRPSRARA